MVLLIVATLDTLFCVEMYLIIFLHTLIVLGTVAISCKGGHQGIVCEINQLKYVKCAKVATSIQKHWPGKSCFADGPFICRDTRES
jgi:hypothetical protein